MKTCSVQGIFKTSDVELHDPQSLACPTQSVNVFGDSLFLEFEKLQDING